jgi:hypothetical protein
VKVPPTSTPIRELSAAVAMRYRRDMKFQIAAAGAYNEVAHA